jgi:hypothetical protein
MVGRGPVTEDDLRSAAARGAWCRPFDVLVGVIAPGLVFVTIDAGDQLRGELAVELARPVGVQVAYHRGIAAHLADLGRRIGDAERRHAGRRR